MLESACCCFCCFCGADSGGGGRDLAPLGVGGLLVGVVLAKLPAVVLLPLVFDAADEEEII